MKGVFLGEENHDHPHHSKPPSTMFSKLHQHHNHNQQPPPPQFSNHQSPPTFHHHPFHPPTSQNSEESLSPTTTTTTPPTTTTTIKKESTPHDGGSIEILRRPRGRPPGSKNKPKPPIIITQESEPPMRPYVLELSPNIDIVETLTRFCRTRAIGLCILSGSGSVANVTLRQPSTTSPSATVTFHGRFDILSVSATILPRSDISVTSESNDNVIAHGPCNFTISLAGPQGQVFGGAVVGPLASAGVIYLVSATFINPCYQRLPIEEDSRNGSASAGGNGVGGGVNTEGPQNSELSPADGGHQLGEGMGMYQLSSDVIWAPTARQPPPPQPPQPPY